MLKIISYNIDEENKIHLFEKKHRYLAYILSLYYRYKLKNKSERRKSPTDSQSREDLQDLPLNNTTNRASAQNSRSWRNSRSVSRRRQMV
jgi:hypothetical protein